MHTRKRNEDFMKYSMPLQVRYSEVDIYGLAKPYKILEYFQDCCIMQSESLGYKVKEELEKDRGWFLLSWNVDIHQRPSMGEVLKIVTEPYKMRGFYGYRRFWLENQKGEIYVSADSLWLLMDLKKMIPQRVPKDMVAAYIQDVSDDQIRVKRKLEEQGEWSKVEEFVVSHHYLDSNSHVNNAHYIMWAEEHLPEDFQIRKVMVDYRQSSFEHDRITCSRIIEENKIRIRFTNQKDTLIALLEFSADDSIL